MASYSSRGYAMARVNISSTEGEVGTESWGEVVIYFCRKTQAVVHGTTVSDDIRNYKN